MGVIAESAVNVLSEALERADSVLLGPGFGQEETSLDFLRTLFLGSKEDQGRGIGFLHPSRDEGHRPEAAMSPAVIDADGLKLLSRIPEWHTLLPPSTVLTPHPGEMSLITGEDKDEIQADRIAAARRWAETWGHVVVLKGAYTAVASPEGKVTVIPVASPALARAGTGDVLAGIIAGLRAQGMSGYEASVLGCYVHAQAGVAAAESLGTTASVLAGEVAASVADILGAWRF
jgi:NAD(P)H-hydrate epimerase